MRDRNDKDSKIPENIIDVLIDYSERAVDSLIESDALREIPLLKSFLGFKDGWLRIRDYLYEKKVEALLSLCSLRLNAMPPVATSHT